MKIRGGLAVLAMLALTGAPAIAQALKGGAILQNLPGTWTPEAAEAGGARACNKAPVKITVRDQGMSFVFDNVPAGGTTTFVRGKLTEVYSSDGKLGDGPMVLRLDERPTKPGVKGGAFLLTMPNKDKIFWRPFSSSGTPTTFVRCPPAKP